MPRPVFTCADGLRGAAVFLMEIEYHICIDLSIFILKFVRNDWDKKEQDMSLFLTSFRGGAEGVGKIKVVTERKISSFFLKYIKQKGQK